MSSAGQRVRWTLSGRLGTTSAMRFWYIVSARKGRIGATRVRVTRAAWSVANAASRSAGSAPARIRSRDRRRYHVERSSMKASVARIASSVS